MQKVSMLVPSCLIKIISHEMERGSNVNKKIKILFIIVGLRSNTLEGHSVQCILPTLKFKWAIQIRLMFINDAVEISIST